MLRALLFLFLLLMPLPLGASNRTDVERQFRIWLEQEVWPRAAAKGVSRPVFERAFAGVSLNWSLPDLVAPGSKPKVDEQQRQAEFGAPGRYFNRNSVDGATSVGRQMAASVSR